jgi:hypothetical protein
MLLIVTSRPPFVRLVDNALDDLTLLQLFPVAAGPPGGFRQADEDHAVLGVVFVDDDQELFADVRMLAGRELLDGNRARGRIADVAEHVFARQRLDLRFELGAGLELLGKGGQRWRFGTGRGDRLRSRRHRRAEGGIDLGFHVGVERRVLGNVDSPQRLRHRHGDVHRDGFDDQRQGLTRGSRFAVRGHGPSHVG